MTYNKQHKKNWKQEAKTNHNQHKPFNAHKYGKLWSSIGFAHDWQRTPEGDANGAVIGKLVLGNTQVELTFSETNRIIDTLTDAQHRYNVGVRLGTSNGDAGVTNQPPVY
tara:strand:- start:4396 stop:4725 length:330 start_codon:yes stop_codon:yes gene_type:complete